jgi:hypothetical protein
VSVERLRPDELARERPARELAARSATPGHPHPIALITGLQQTVGNAAVARLLAPSAQLARFKSNASGAVGGHSDEAAVLDDPLRKGGKLKVGEQGYVREALRQLPRLAGQKLSAYAGARLRPVDITFNRLEKHIEEAAAKQQQAEDEKGGPPSAQRNYQRTIDTWKEAGEVLASQKIRQQQWVQRFNAGVPRANQMLISLARLDALQTTLGVSDPQKLAESLVHSLDKARPLAERSQRAGAPLDVPQADESVSAAARQLSLSQNKMQTAWLGVQQELVKDHIAEIEKKGDVDRDRLAQINETIQTMRAIGATIDLGMAVMGKVGPALEGTSTKPTKSQLGDMLEDEAPDVRDRSGAKSAKETGKLITDALGIEIPTSAGALLEMATKMFYAGELDGIRKRLRRLDIAVAAYTKASGEIALQKTVEEYKDAVDQFEENGKALRSELRARQLNYLKMGEQLDRAGRSDPETRGDRYAKQERFATVMTVVAAVREVLAMADGAEAGFQMHSLQLGQWILDMGSTRPKFAYTKEEDRAMGKVLAQLGQFERNTEGLREILGPVDAKAGELMKAMSAGASEAAAY